MLGYDWYLEGKMEKKMNTFADFISVAEGLVRDGYTTPELLSAEGRSAGGLLAGAVFALRPDLFHSVVAGVPFVDVLTTMSDPSIPLTVPEWEQWGNPNKAEDYELMSRYSPYDLLTCRDYPHLLMLTGLHDPRVGYWEPAKMMAKLREYDTGNSLQLLKTELDEGHFGGSDRYRHLKETAIQFTFLLSTLSLK